MSPKLSASSPHIDAQGQYRQLLAEGIAALNIDCSPKQLELLMQYLNLLVRWNKTYNLTAIRDYHVKSDIKKFFTSPIGGGSNLHPFSGRVPPTAYEL